jgi:hypothetical protein
MNGESFVSFAQFVVELFLLGSPTLGISVTSYHLPIYFSYTVKVGAVSLKPPLAGRERNFR